MTECFAARRIGDRIYRVSVDAENIGLATCMWHSPHTTRLRISDKRGSVRGWVEYDARTGVWWSGSSELGVHIIIRANMIEHACWKNRQDK